MEEKVGIGIVCTRRDGRETGRHKDWGRTVRGSDRETVTHLKEDNLQAERSLHLHGRSGPASGGTYPSMDRDFQRGLLDDKTDSYILQGCYFHLKNYIRKSQDSATMLSLNSILEEDGPHLEEILIADDLASYDRVETLLQIEAIGSGISQRERDVLFFCLEGMTMREIGKKMGISHVSVVKIRNKIKERYQKLNGIDGENGRTRKSLAA